MKFYGFSLRYCWVKLPVDIRTMTAGIRRNTVNTTTSNTLEVFVAPEAQFLIIVNQSKADNQAG